MSSAVVVVVAVAAIAWLQRGVVHPDELLQWPQPMAAVLRSQCNATQTWEWTSRPPVRSAAAIAAITAPFAALPIALWSACRVAAAAIAAASVVLLLPRRVAAVVVCSGAFLSLGTRMLSNAAELHALCALCALLGDGGKREPLVTWAATLGALAGTAYTVVKRWWPLGDATTSPSTRVDLKLKT